MSWSVSLERECWSFVRAIICESHQNVRRRAPSLSRDACCADMVADASGERSMDADEAGQLDWWVELTPPLPQTPFRKAPLPMIAAGSVIPPGIPQAHGQGQQIHTPTSGQTGCNGTMHAAHIFRTNREVYYVGNSVFVLGSRKSWGSKPGQRETSGVGRGLPSYLQIVF